MPVDEETRSTHESYGQVQFSRISGGRSRLYGSAIRKHGDSIILVIRRSELIHSLGYDRHFGRKQLIEVELSAAQFAALLTTMNVGMGVPCTIRYIGGEQMEHPPEDEPLEHEKIAQELAHEGKYATRINASLRDAEDMLRAMLSRKGSIRKGDVSDTLAKVVRARRDVKEDLPFMLGQFREAAEKVKTTVMAEADAWLTSVVQRAGLKALQGKPQLQIDEDE